MAARWAVPDRIHGPTGLKGIADSLGEPVRPPEDLRAEPHDIERYLGNGYLETVARGLSHSAASGARRAGNADEVAGGTRGPASRRR